MNMQTIQVFFLLFDIIIKLASWRMVTATMDRIGDGAGKSLARSLASIAVVSAVLYAFPPTSIVGAVLPAGCFGGAMVSHMRIGTPLISITLFGCYLGALLWGGLWLWRRSLRALMPRRSRFA